MKKNVFTLVAALMLCLIFAGGVWASDDSFAGQKPLSQKDIDCFCSWAELEKEYSATDMERDVMTAKREAIFKKAGWDELRQEYVFAKMLMITQILMTSASDEEISQAAGDQKSLVPSKKEIDLVKKNKDKVSAAIGVPL